MANILIRGTADCAAKHSRLQFFHKLFEFESLALHFWLRW